MANYGEILTNIIIGAGQSIRRNAGDTAFEAFTPGTSTVSAGNGITDTAGVFNLGTTALTGDVEFLGGGSGLYSFKFGSAGGVLQDFLAYVDNQFLLSASNGVDSAIIAVTPTTAGFNLGTGVGFTIVSGFGAAISVGGDTSGDMLYNSSGYLTRLPIGASGTVLRSSGATPSWGTIATLKTDLGLSGTNSGDQTIVLTGNVTGSGTGSFATTISNNAVTNTMLTDVPTATFKGRTTAGTGDPEDLTAAQAKILLDLAGSNTGDQTITLTGDVTGSGTGTFTTTISAGSVDIAMLSATGTPSATTFLRGDNTWAVPASGSPAGSSNEVQFNTGGSFAASSNFTYDPSTKRLTVTGGTYFITLDPDISVGSDPAIILGNGSNNQGIYNNAGINNFFGNGGTVNFGNTFSAGVSGTNSGTVNYLGGLTDLGIKAGSPSSGNTNGGNITITTGTGSGTGINGSLLLTDGADRSMGVATLVAGTVTVNNEIVTANTRIFITCQAAGGTIGTWYISARTAGTSFTISSSSGSDTSTIAWLLIEPN